MVLSDPLRSHTLTFPEACVKQAGGWIQWDSSINSHLPRNFYPLQLQRVNASFVSKDDYYLTSLVIAWGKKKKKKEAYWYHLLLVYVYMAREAYLTVRTVHSESWGTKMESSPSLPLSIFALSFPHPLIFWPLGYRRPLNNAGVRDPNSHAAENPHVTFDSPQNITY